MNVMITLLGEPWGQLAVIALSAALGYWSGWLFTRINIFKIACWIFILPGIVFNMMSIDQMIWTIPYAIGSVFGFADKNRIMDLYYRIVR